MPQCGSFTRYTRLVMLPCGGRGAHRDGAHLFLISLQSCQGLPGLELPFLHALPTNQCTKAAQAGAGLRDGHGRRGRPRPAVLCSQLTPLRSQPCPQPWICVPRAGPPPANFLMNVSTEVPFAFTTPPRDRYSDPCSN